MGVTIKQVAALSGVSTATVSKYLNGVKLKEKNKISVENAIRELGFKANTIARNLRTNKSMTVGILIPELDNIFSTKIISYVENELTPHGYSTIICDYRSNPELEKQKLAFLLDKMVDGLVVMPDKLKNKDIKDLKVPIVFIDRIINDSSESAVLIDNKKATYNATEFLIGNGHRRIGIICGNSDIYTAEERRKGYTEAMVANNIFVDENMVLHGRYDVQTGYTLTQKLMQGQRRPTAIIATNNDITTGSIIALHDMGYTVPDDVSFIGFDNEELSRAMRPELSVVLQPLEEIGKNVAKIILDKMNYNSAPNSYVMLEPIFLSKGSVKRVVPEN